MSAQTVQSLLDELLNMGDSRYLYAPVAVFGYIGYNQGFDFEFPTRLMTHVGIVTATPLELTIFSAILVSPSIAFIKRGEDGIEQNEKLAKQEKQRAREMEERLARSDEFSDIPLNTHNANEIIWSDDSPLAVASRWVQGIGVIGIFLVLLLHIESIYAIYETNIFSETIIGLLISLFQVLVIVTGISTNTANIVHSILLFILRRV